MQSLPVPVCNTTGDQCFVPDLFGKRQRVILRCIPKKRLLFSISRCIHLLLEPRNSPEALPDQFHIAKRCDCTPEMKTCYVPLQCHVRNTHIFGS